MSVNAVAFLETLRCIHEKDGSGHSETYIWPALLAISPSGSVSITAPALENARVVIKNDMRAGTCSFPPSVGVVGVQFDDGSRALILAVALWEPRTAPGRYTDGFPGILQRTSRRYPDNLFGLMTMLRVKRKSMRS